MEVPHEQRNKSAAVQLPLYTLPYKYAYKYRSSDLLKKFHPLLVIATLSVNTIQTTCA